jgi:hypothetical protein
MQARAFLLEGRARKAHSPTRTVFARSARMRTTHLMLVAAMIGASPPGTLQAGANYPVYIVVTGQTAIRLQLALGRTAPCDSSENRMMFDGMLAPGRYTFETGSEVVCYQYTSASFPASGWSEPRVMPTRIRNHGPLTVTLP